MRHKKGENRAGQIIKGPEQSYSRHLDAEVARQEYPYGIDYRMEWNETEAGASRGDLNSVSKLKKGY